MSSFRFEWDERKGRANRGKHGVSFEEAQTVFFDEYAIEYDDPDHSGEEERFLMLGWSAKLRVLVVCHCIRSAPRTIRIISARRATRQEREAYERRLPS
ncbi:MAG: BrnT family toxin [Planctomycetes bacterium]|nr:BrnT family toxin [Planctomycetota bacterium]